MDEYIKDVGKLKYQEGYEAGRTEVKIETALRMHRHGCDPEFISRCVGVDPETVKEWIKESDREN